MRRVPGTVRVRSLRACGTRVLVRVRSLRACGTRVGALCGLLLASHLARADTPPSAWDVAKDPASRDRWRCHVRVEQLLAHSDDDAVADSRVERELRLEAARSMLEEADAARSPDVRLRFDLGTVYYALGYEEGGRVDLYQKAIDVLRPALDASPDAPGATAALETLVYCYTRMNRPSEELAMWRRLIPRLEDARSRAQDMMNMGEAEMRLGRVDDAVGTFREVLRMCGELPNSGSSTYVLTLWDLAVAVDRAGDPRAALESAARASRMTAIGSGGVPTTGAALIAHDRAVFFVPEWEREWYLALRDSAAAHEAKDARSAAERWAQAERHWARYIERASAEGSGDLFVPIARVRLKETEARRLAAEKQAVKLPRPAERRPAWVEDP
jgi:tetratricopeptide (TPR) repeat protein